MRFLGTMLLAGLIQLAGGGAALAQCDGAKSAAACAEKPYCRWTVDPKWAVNGACWIDRGVLDIQEKFEAVAARLLVCGKDYSDKALEVVIRRELQARYPGVAADEIDKLAAGSAALVWGVLTFDEDTANELFAKVRREMTKEACAKLKRQYRAIIK